MKKLTILLFSIFISFNSSGEWLKIAENTDGDVFYINPDRITRFKDSVTAKILLEKPKPGLHSVRSLKLSVRGNCKTNKYREEAVSYYRTSMGKGSTLYETNLTEGLKDVPKGSIGRIILDYVCSFDKKEKKDWRNIGGKVDTKEQKSDKTKDNKATSDYKKDLITIKDLLDSGLITKEDYEKQKQKILDRM